MALLGLTWPYHKDTYLLHMFGMYTYIHENFQNSFLACINLNLKFIVNEISAITNPIFIQLRVNFERYEAI